MDLDKKPVDSEGEWNPETRLVVRKVVVQRSLGVGTWTDVFAEAMAGLDIETGDGGAAA